MRLMVTGLRGTVGPEVRRAASVRGWHVQGWDREAVPPEDTAARNALLGPLQVDGVIHLAVGSEDWAASLATFARERGIPMVHVSSAMVFDHRPDGPHRPGDAMTARDDYGRLKQRTEERVAAAAPGATIARIGWQIGREGEGNHMVAHLERQQAESGAIRASTAWRPACSFLTDTAEALLCLVETRPPGVVHLDSNAEDAWSFLEVVQALKRGLGKDHWQVVPTQDYQHDQRLVGHEALMPRLSQVLGLPAAHGAAG
jgi:dTDP-4-dehydrorhamnose reductase